MLLSVFVWAVLTSGLMAGSRSPGPAAGTSASIPAASIPAASAGSMQSGGPSSAPAASSAIMPPLPAMLAAIGDSYSQAYDVSPDLPHHQDNVQSSWVLGTGKGDGILSLRERFDALGASLTVVDAATSRMKMSDAVRQANLVVRAAQNLSPGATVYVTFELGTNDLCDQPKTDPAAFEAQLDAAIAILRDGLPPGSRILMLSVPDFGHFHTITQADPSTKSFFATPQNSRRCAPFLGADSPVSMKQAQSILARYDASLIRACEAIESSDGPSGRLHCTSNGDVLAERDFTVADLSTYDYFHPSYSGQAKMADAAWQAGDWGQKPLPASAESLAPASGGPDAASLRKAASWREDVKVMTPHHIDSPATWIGASLPLRRAIDLY